MPGLLPAEQVPGTPDLEVAHCDLEARPEISVLTDRLEPLVRLLREHPVARVEEVRVRPLPASSDAPAQLVELGEAEQVSAVDDEGVHGRQVEATLDDRRAHQDVVLVLVEAEDDALQPALIHLAVSNCDARLGNEVTHVLGDDVDVLHPVVDVEDLALAQQLAADRLRDRAVVVLADVGENRLTVFGRRVHQRKVADAGE